jgi:hypothetical protein
MSCNLQLAGSKVIVFRGELCWSVVTQKFRQKLELMHKPPKMCKILNCCRKMLLYKTLNTVNTSEIQSKVHLNIEGTDVRAVCKQKPVKPGTVCNVVAQIPRVLKVILLDLAKRGSRVH